MTIKRTRSRYQMTSRSSIFGNDRLEKWLSILYIRNTLENEGQESTKSQLVAKKAAPEDTSLTLGDSADHQMVGPPALVVRYQF